MVISPTAGSEAFAAGRRGTRLADRAHVLSGPHTFRQFVWLWNVVQRFPTPELHTQIARWLEDCWDRRRTRLLLMVFRNAGKSTLTGLFCAWLLMRNPDLRLLVVSAEQSLATRMTRNIRRIIERHPLVRKLLPGRLTSWAADHLTVERNVDHRDPSVMARGITANITGARADVIVCDDVEVPRNCDTPAKRADLRERLNELSFVLSPGGTMLYIGTPHHYHSIYGDKAMPEYGEERPFLAGFERLVLPILDEQGRSRWPERFPNEEIERIRSETGPARFRSQMLLQPTPLHDVRLDPDKLIAYEEEISVTEANRTLLLRIGDKRMISASCWWDPAMGRPGGGDASVVAALFVDEAGHFHLHDIRYLEARLEGPDDDEATAMCRQVARFAAALELPSITVETNGLGKFLPALLRREIAKMRAAISVREHVSTIAKERRILDAFDPVLAARRLHAHRRVWQTPFITEMREWRPGASCRDDGLDAVAGCLASEPVRLGAFSVCRRQDWRPGAQTHRARSSFRL